MIGDWETRKKIYFKKISSTNHFEHRDKINIQIQSRCDTEIQEQSQKFSLPFW